MTAQLGMVGLGRMGANMTERLRRAGIDVKTYDRNAESTADSLEELVSFGERLVAIDDPKT